MPFYSRSVLCDLAEVHVYHEANLKRGDVTERFQNMLEHYLKLLIKNLRSTAEQRYQKIKNINQKK